MNSSRRPVWLVDWGIQVLISAIAGYLLLDPIWSKTFLAGGQTMPVGIGLILTFLVFLPIWFLQFMALRTGIESRGWRWGMLLTGYFYGLVPLGVIVYSWSRRFGLSKWQRWVAAGALWIVGSSAFWFVYMLLAGGIITLVLLPVN